MAQNTFTLEIPKNNRLEPMEVLINKEQNSSFGTVYPTLCSFVEEARTFFKTNSTYIYIPKINFLQ